MAIYTINGKRNILSSGRFNYDVLDHTDLTRIQGFSGEINLEMLNWGNYDLKVIDESHNFRNNNPKKDGLTRYSRLMDQIIRSEVKTKVLMLSATPVNIIGRSEEKGGDLPISDPLLDWLRVPA